MTDFAIQVRDLHKQYPGRGGPVQAVNGLDLEIRMGECFGLLGPNGAGKTTTVEILEGLNRPTYGEVNVLGLRWDQDEKALRERIGVTLQETRFPEKSTTYETVRLFRSFYQQGIEPEEALRLVTLESKASAFVETLSGGQQRRLAVAVALVGDPELIFLDEPTTGLDPQSRRQLWDVIRDLKGRGRTIILTTHYMDEAERLCDRVAIIDQGKILALGSPADLIARLGGEHVVEFALDGDGQDPAADPTSWADLPTVLTARAEGDGFALTVGEPHSAIPALLDRLEDQNLTLARLTTRQVSLEDVFVNLTGRHLRDDESEAATNGDNAPRSRKRRSALETPRKGPFMPRYSSLFELFLTRLREFYRQPAHLLGLRLPHRPRHRPRSGLPQPTPRSRPRHHRRECGLVSSPRGPPASPRSPPAPQAAPASPSKPTPRPKPSNASSPAKPRWSSSPTPLAASPTASTPPAPKSVTARVLVDTWIQHQNGRQDPIAATDELVTEPGSRYIDFLIPGLMGLNTMGGGMWGIGFLLVNFRIGKLLKRFQATPMPRRNFLLALLGARLTFLLPDVLVLLAVGVFLFGMPIRGSLALIALIEVVGALAFAGLGLLVASRASTTETVSGLMNLVMLPMWMLSGVFFSADRFPSFMQPLIQALPLTQIVSALRLVMLEGAGLATVAPSITILAAWAIITFTIALRIFKWS